MTSENFRLWSEANRQRDPVAVKAVEDQGIGE